MQQDLYKTAAFRAIMRARRECLAALGETKCGGVATDALTNTTRYALKLGEHTWVSFRVTSDNAATQTPQRSAQLGFWQACAPAPFTRICGNDYHW